MKVKMNRFKLVAILAIIGILPVSLLAQLQGKIDNLRAYDQSGINVFENLKVDNTPFDGLRLRFGAGFTQQYQSLTHSNTALNSGVTISGSTVTSGVNKLYPLQPGFMTSQANLYTDVQLGDGIRLSLTTYLSARHHNEAWVKGGYIQFDKLPFKGQFWNDLMKFTTIKVGHMEINYGDAHFRRSDGGHTLYNPFMESYIMDAYATEIGTEIYMKKNNFFGMLGVSGGMIKGNVDSVMALSFPYDSNTNRNPSIYLKAGWDKKIDKDLRVRLSGSWYYNSCSAGSGLTFYGGDRTGSNYQNVVEKWKDATGAVQASTATAFSGRVNPGFSKSISAMMFNAFVKYQGLEFFGTYETSTGRSKSDVDATAKSTFDRKASQYAVDFVYRMGKTENTFLGFRYNSATGNFAAGLKTEQTVNRLAFAAGWFITKNTLLKAEYVSQEYQNFDNASAVAGNDYRTGAKFSGVVVEAVVGF